jgi:hypothetical protein
VEVLPPEIGSEATLRSVAQIVGPNVSDCGDAAKQFLTETIDLALGITVSLSSLDDDGAQTAQLE